ncbi:DUF948 domain-containing protein [Georgenia sp. 311]|uniref:DUF948 domain-containing protein n=1 Tax=Georgenia wutianyii TaxID=2585135 RepID=A0ABX5VLJ4_9MICO|nr:MULTISPECIES: DUF948 domain-containing protein [Georgenia]QDB79351.1 DUF948 domain-containing protein [Georgenia wutianyii]TNC17432.1 DUF948 domain-containing protein [Georgenia sp. 311]
MNIGDIAGIVAAVAFLLLVAFLAVPLLKVGAVLDAATDSVREITAHALPVVDEAAATIRAGNAQIVKVDAVTTAATEVSQNVSALTTLVSATVGGPLIKVSAFSYAVRRFFRRGA